MSDSVKLSARARAELLEATAWYLEEGGIEVGLRFAREIEETFERIAANPSAWTELRRGV